MPDSIQPACKPQDCRPPALARPEDLEARETSFGWMWTCPHGREFVFSGWEPLYSANDIPSLRERFGVD